MKYRSESQSVLKCYVLNNSMEHSNLHKSNLKLIVQYDNSVTDI
jgi:hypothetical protein